MKQSAGRRRSFGGARGPRSVIGAMAVEAPEEAKAEILEALDRARGRVIGAAANLALCRRHLGRLIWALDLWPQVDEIRERWSKKTVDTPVTRLIGKQSPRGDSELGA